MKTALAILGFVVALVLFELKLRIRKRRRLEAEHLAAVRAIHAPQEARAALTQWILQRTFEFTVAGAVKATQEAGRPMTESEVSDVCASLSIAVPSLRGVLPPETLRPLPHVSRFGPSLRGLKPKFSTVQNGARVTTSRPPETMRMTRTEYLEWQRNQGKPPADYDPFASLGIGLHRPKGKQGA